MHQVLQLGELLRQIVEDLRLGDNGFGGKRDLLSMALTCRQFYQPTIECLWHSLHGLTPVLHCFPLDVCSRSTTGKFEVSGMLRSARSVNQLVSSQGPHRPLTPDDWDRVLQMSGYVKVLLINNYRPPELLALQLFSDHLGLPTATSLFPKLQEFYWRGSLRNANMCCLSSFIGPALKVVDVYSLNDFDTAFFAQILSQYAPSLTSYTLRGDVENEDEEKTSMVLEKTGHLFRSLTTFESDGILLSNTAFCALATLPNLTRLSCSVGRSDDPPHDNMDLFPSLEYLQIYLGHSSQWVAAFMKTCRMPKLSTIIVDFDGFPWSSDVLSIAKALGSRDTLREITLNCEESPVLCQLLASETIKPLLSCSDLRKLHVKAKHSRDLDDSVLEDIGHALPHLISLFLSITYNTGSVTYRGLHTLATHCPQLVRVRVPLDFSAFDNTDLRSPSRLTQCVSLREIYPSLDSSDSGSYDLNLAAAVLFRAFPEATFFKSRASTTIEETLNRMFGLFRLVQLKP